MKSRRTSGLSVAAALTAMGSSFSRDNSNVFEIVSREPRHREPPMIGGRTKKASKFYDTVRPEVRSAWNARGFHPVRMTRQIRRAQERAQLKAA